MEERLGYTKMMNKKKFIEENINLVYFIINKYYKSYSKDEDIIQCGMLGLCKAAERWEPTKSKFSTFAGSCIRNEIKYELQARTKRQVECSLESLMEGDKSED